MHLFFAFAMPVRTRSAARRQREPKRAPDQAAPEKAPPGMLEGGFVKTAEYLVQIVAGALLAVAVRHWVEDYFLQ